jgi:hypothetical protein
MIRVHVALVFAAMLLWVGPAKAALGGDASSVLSDGTALSGVLHTTAMKSYDIDEIDAAGDVRVREFVSRNGTVFALSWSGSVPPDLQQLLGQSFRAYSAALAGIVHSGLHRSVRVALPELVVESSGHLRAYSGRAYLPAMMPIGVSLGDVR